MSQRVLVVDDMAIVREPIAASLSDAGFEIRQASNGKEALLLMTDWVPQLILLDVAMPEMDGLTMLAKLRELPSFKDLPVILLTAVSDRDAVRKAAALGIRDYLLKSSFSLKDLLGRVNKHIAGAARPAEVPVRSASVIQPAQTSRQAQVSQSQTDRTLAKTSDKEFRVIPPRAAQPAPAPSTQTPIPSRIKTDSERFVLLTREQTQSRLAEIASVRTCAGIVAQVTALANSPRSDVTDIVRVIEADPVMAAKVLQMANSAAYRSKFTRLSGIEDAVRKIGMRAIQNLAISVGIFDAFPPDAADGFNTMRCWQHSFAVASMMRILLAGWADEDRERGALAGLCHELGEIVLRQYFAAEYELIISHAQSTGMPRHAVELSALSMRHADLVAEVLTRIGLPPNITMPIMRFHDGGVTGISADDSKIVKTMQFAEWMANGMLLSVSMDAPVGPINRADLRRLCGDAPMPELNMLRTEVLTTTNFLARLPAADEARFLRPIRPRQNLQIWYAHHQSYADADPLASVFDLLGNLQVEDHLPKTAEDIERQDAFFVASPVPESGPLASSEIQELTQSPSYRGQPICLMTGMTGAGPIGNMHCLQLPMTLQHMADLIDRAVIAKGAVPVKDA